MVFVSDLFSRFRLSLLGALLLISGSPAVFAQVAMNANVEFSGISQTDPHPTTYTWEG